MSRSLFGHSAELLYSTLAEHDKTVQRLIELLTAESTTFMIGAVDQGELIEVHLKGAPKELIDIIEKLSLVERERMVADTEKEAQREAAKLATLIEKIAAARTTPIPPPPPPKPEPTTRYKNPYYDNIYGV